MSGVAGVTSATRPPTPSLPDACALASVARSTQHRQRTVLPATQMNGGHVICGQVGGRVGWHPPPGAVVAVGRTPRGDGCGSASGLGRRAVAGTGGTAPRATARLPLSTSPTGPPAGRLGDQRAAVQARCEWHVPMVAGVGGRGHHGAPGCPDVDPATRLAICTVPQPRWWPPGQPSTSSTGAGVLRHELVVR
jgi:hypothetical protein